MELELFIDCAEAIIEPVVIAWAAPKLLSMTRPRLFAFIEIGGSLLVNIAFANILHWFWVGFAFVLFLSLVLPCLFWSGSWARRVCAVAALELCSAVATMVSQLCWEPLFGTEVPQDWSDELVVFGSNIPAWIGYELIYVGAFAALLGLLMRLFRRWGSDRIQPELPFVLLVAAEFLIAGVIAVVHARSLGFPWYAVQAGAMLLCLVAGIVAIVASENLRAARVARQQAERLTQVRSAYLDGYRSARCDVMELAHLRHDFRNTLAAADALIARGDDARAERLLYDLKERCLGVGTSEGQDSPV